jgi:hypothetical protein
MNIKEFHNLNAVGASLRNGSALIAISLDSEWMPGCSICGSLSIYEEGEEIGRWLVSVDGEGTIEPRADDFYRAVELFDTMKRQPE